MGVGSRGNVFIIMICVAIEAGLLFYKSNPFILGALVLCSCTFILYLLEYMFMIVFSTNYLVNMSSEEREKDEQCL